MLWRCCLALLLAVAPVAAADEKDEAWFAARRSFWAFRKPVRPPVPQISSPWVRTPIDAFVLEALREKKLTPSPPLDRERLLRRVTLDLTGLPPTPGEVSTFRLDASADAYEKVVDRLLASPHYGERWALRWLDVVRYADTNGFESDAERPHAWRFRDYVVRSFHLGKPYDRFLQEQIAGDEMFPGDPDALIATGLHRAGPIHVVGGMQDEEMNRQEVLTEITGSIGSVFLGLTIGCARCHNHKFDPILQSDYYRLQAVFAATALKDVPLGGEEEKGAHERGRKEFDARLAPVRKELEAIERPYRERLRAERKAKLEPRYAQALEIPAERRTPEQKLLAKEAEDQVKIYWDELVALLAAPERERRAALRRSLHQIELERPDPLRSAFAVANMENAPTTHILKVGDHRHKQEAVEPGFPRVLLPEAPVARAAAGRRTALARWLVSPEHPLTARVMVNRIWQLRMGSGFVATANDFGALGARPTNQKLLDWLAAELVAGGWNVKAIDRMIVLSSVYRQSAAADAARSRIDPDNKLYWRMHRRRLEAELIRDNVLAVSGGLNPRLGGKPVRVPIEREIYDLIFTEGEPDNLWPVTPDPAEHRRRSLYLLNKRTVRLPFLTNFDQPDAMTSCPERSASTHALQALSLMNSDFIASESRKFAERIEREAGQETQARIRRAYLVALARDPRPEEAAMARTFFSRGGRLEEFCLALLNRHEFLYVP